MSVKGLSAGMTFCRGLVSAARGKVNLLVAGAAGLAAGIFESWPLLAVAGTAYVAMVTWDLANPRFWEALGRAPPPRPTLPEASSLIDPRTQVAIQTMLNARRTLALVLADTSPRLKLRLGPALDLVGVLETRAVELVSGAEELARSLSFIDAQAVRREIERLCERAEAASDPGAREHYVAALAVRHEHLRALEEVSAVKDRLLANLDRVVGTLDSLPSRIICLRALDARAAECLSADGGALEGIAGDVSGIEEALRALGSTEP